MKIKKITKSEQRQKEGLAYDVRVLRATHISSSDHFRHTNYFHSTVTKGKRFDENEKD